MRTALIFRERLLAPSETFIIEQARSLERYRPVLAGLRRITPSLGHSIPEVLFRNGDSPIDKLAANLFRNFPIGKGFFARLRAERPSMVHAHFAIDAVQALRIAGKLHLPLVVSLHGFDVTSTQSALAASNAGRHYLRNRERLYREASAFICVSQFIRRAALRAGFPKEKLLIHYTGIDCERFRPANLVRDPKLIVFVGRLVEKKGCEYLLRAMAHVQRHNAEACLEIIGEGPLRVKLEAMAAALSLRVVFRGVQGSDQVLRAMSRARILCNPSVTAASGDKEGFGMVFAEAQAVGTPVVSFAHAAIPEAVSHGETGLLSPEKDVDALATSLLTLLQDDALWTSMSRRATAWVHGRFNIAKQSASLESIYDDCIATYQQTNMPFRKGAQSRAEYHSLLDI